MTISGRGEHTDKKKMYTPPTQEEITAFADRHLEPWTIRSGELIAKTCPFCNGGDSGDTGTFYVSLATGQYFCHRGKCGAKGGWLALLRRFGEAGNIASVSKGLKTLELTPKERTETIDEYFANRGISEATLDKFQIGATPEGNIMFPFYVESELVYAKYRQPTTAPVKRKEWAQAGATPVLFGMDLCNPDDPLVICEGQIDAMSLSEVGIPNAVSVPTGCENFEWIEPCWSWMENFERIIIFGDNDAPGQKMVRKLANRLGEDRVWVVDEYPENCKDANDILTAFGKDVLLQTFRSAKEIPIQGLLDLADVEDVDPTTVPRIKTGIPALDEAINGLEAGGVTVVSGPPSYGKSTLCGTLLLNAIEQDHKVCAVSMELTAQKFREWICLQAAGSDWITTKWDPVKNKEVPVVYPPVIPRINDWYRGKFFLYESSDIGDKTIGDSVLDVFTMAAKRKGCDLFLVDNLMTVLMDTGDDEYREQGVFMAKVKRFAVRYNAHVIVVAHPRKNKGNATITQDDVAGSKYIINLASNAFSVEKPDIRIFKSRDSGILKLIECCYAADSRRIYQSDVGDTYNFSWDKTGLTPPTKLACDLPGYGVFRSNNTQMF